MLGGTETIPSAAMISRGYKVSPPNLQMSKTGTSVTSGKKKESGDGCTHCGNPKHTREICFKLTGIQNGGKSCKRNESTGRAALTESQPSLLLSNESSATTESSDDSGNSGYSLCYSE